MANEMENELPQAVKTLISNITTTRSINMNLPPKHLRTNSNQQYEYTTLVPPN
jgi:hypothetical protein